MKQYTRQPWGSSEDAILHKYYGLCSPKDLLEKLPGRSRNSVYGRVRYLGINFRQNHFWTDKEIDILVDNFQSASEDEITKLIPLHSWEAIYYKARELNLNYKYNTWTDTEKDFLKLFCAEFGVEDAHKWLPRHSDKAVKSQYYNMKLHTL